jgi:type I restriction enzyme M protein
MITKRSILELLKRPELEDVARRFEVSVPRPGRRDELVGATSRSRKVVLAEVLAELTVPRLKEICRAADLHDGGTKASLVERLAPNGAIHPQDIPNPASNAANGATGAKTKTARVPSPPPSGDPITPSELESHLWEAANILRGSPVDRTDWKSYILPLLFFKRVCDVWDEEYAQAVSTYGEDFADEHRFQVPEGSHWRDVRATAKNVGTALANAMRGIEAANQKHLYGVFGDAQWTNKDRLPDELLKDLIEHFSALSLGNARAASDVLGDAYEYLIKQFADATNKKAGEFYTPRSVVRLMVDILDPKPGERVYDPACGTGGMLLAAVAHVREAGGDPRTFFGRLYGQEKNLTTAAVARMNLFLHGLEDFVIERGDTLRSPIFTDPSTGGLATFDVVLANPPFSLDKWGREVWDSDPWGRALAALPPESNGDFAWVQHMVASMARKAGRAAVVLPIGAMIRRGVEQDVRRFLISNDLVDAVIGLPADLFYGTVVEAVIFVLARDKPADRRGTVLFVDGADVGKRQRASVTLEPSDRELLISAWHKRVSRPGRAALVTIEQIAKRDWALAPKVHVEPILRGQARALPDVAAEFRDQLRQARDSDIAAQQVLSGLRLELP